MRGQDICDVCGEISKEIESLSLNRRFGESEFAKQAGWPANPMDLCPSCARAIGEDVMSTIKAILHVGELDEGPDVAGKVG
jgi:hypothetical protein